MTQLKTFLNQRADKKTLISITEAETFVEDLNTQEKLKFFKSLRLFLKETISAEHLSVDAKDFVKYSHKNLLEEVSERIEVLSDTLDDFDVEVPDERIPGQLLSRNEVIYVFYLLRKLKAIKNCDATVLAASISELTDHSKHTIRRDLSLRKLEDIVLKNDGNKIAELLNQMANMAQNNEL